MILRICWIAILLLAGERFSLTYDIFLFFSVKIYNLGIFYLQIFFIHFQRSSYTSAISYDGRELTMLICDGNNGLTNNGLSTSADQE